MPKNMMLKATTFLKGKRKKKNSKIEGHTGVCFIFNIFYLKSDKLF